MVGAVMLSTVIVWILLEELPHASVATYVRVMLYRLAHEPAATTSGPWLITTPELPPQAPVAATKASSAAGTALAHEYVASTGNPVIVGAVVLFTVIVWLLVATLLHASVAW